MQHKLLINKLNNKTLSYFDKVIPVTLSAHFHGTIMEVKIVKGVRLFAAVLKLSSTINELINLFMLRCQ